MNMAKALCMVFVVLLAGSGMGQEAPKPLVSVMREEAPKRLVRTTCLVKVAQGQEEMTSVVGSLAGTTTVAGKAAKDVLGLNGGPQVDSDIVGTGVIRLSTELLSEVLAKADAFWKAVGVNLHKAMVQVYREEVDQIRTQIDQAESQKMEALAKLQGPSIENPRTRATQEQLSQEADLSAFKPETYLVEAIEQLRNAVKPPLRLVVLWSDLEEAGMDRSIPIGMDGVNPVRLETALKLLVKSVGSSFDLDYIINDGVVTIATRQTLGSLNGGKSTDLDGGLSTGQLTAKRLGLIGAMESSETDLASLQARRLAIEQQIAELNQRISERVAGDPLLRDLQKLVEIQSEVEQNAKRMVELGKADSQHLGEVLEGVVKAKVEMARQREAVAQAAGGELLTKYHSELSEISVRQAEMEAQLGVVRDQLRKVEAQLAQAATTMPQRIERDLAMKSLRQAEERIQDLRQRLASLQAPTITIIGAGD
ncbi:MAG: hypothetical protein KBE04_05555 [Phycisphaerae bacterium]|nr:hypothetical protein [Phycisphaerae bacterium]